MCERLNIFCQQEREKYPCVPDKLFVPAPSKLLYLAYECIWPYDCHPLVTEVNGKPRVLITRLHVICVLRYSNVEMKDPPFVGFRIGKGCFPILVYQKGIISPNSKFLKIPVHILRRGSLSAELFCGSNMFRCTLMDHRVLRYPPKWLGGCFSFNFDKHHPQKKFDSSVLTFLFDVWIFAWKLHCDPWFSSTMSIIHFWSFG